VENRSVYSTAAWREKERKKERRDKKKTMSFML